MEEEWSEIRGFSNYRVSNHGNIFNTQFRKMVKPSKTLQGILKVGMMQDGRQQTRSVKVLVAENFVDGRTHLFDTPIQLDGDQSNCRADNIVWRPRWFAWKYSRQFALGDPYQSVGPIVDITNGEKFDDAHQCAVRRGMLINDIRRSVTYQKPVFPDWHLYEHLK